MQRHFYFTIPISDFSGSPQLPKILSALYAYDGCMGGVNDSSTDEEYMQELKRLVGSTFGSKTLQEKLHCGDGAWREGGLLM